MKVKHLTVGILSTATLVLSGCVGANKNQVLFWAPFGSGYTTALNGLIDNFNASQNVFEVKCESKGSYKNIQTAITNSLTTSTYPNFALGYPDHFAGYIKSGIMLELDDYIEAYDEEHAEELAAKGYESIIDDYYPQYMTENMNLKFDSKGNGYVMGLPFNKSTELLSYNGYMFDYCQAMDPTITKVPDTYAEWEEVGLKIRDVVINNAETSLVEKKLFGTYDDDGRASNFQVVSKDTTKVEGKELLLDCSYVNATNFKVFTWNDLDNMFITLVRQFGGKYTEYTENDMKIYKHGFALFWDQENQPKTKLALETIDHLHDIKVFGTASELTGGDKDTASDPFINNQVFAIASSSGGLSYNVNKNDTRVRLHTVPYNSGDHKYVISQGTNMGLFDQGTDEQVKYSFEAMVAMSTGEIQGEWARDTGYYPASKSAMESQVYTEFLSKDYGNRQALLRAYKESFVINRDVYRGENEGWTQFVDPGFAGSSLIREQVGQILPGVLQRDAGVSIESCVEAVMRNLSDYVRK